VALVLAAVFPLLATRGHRTAEAPPGNRHIA
jgi:hypothetical protein